MANVINPFGLTGAFYPFTVFNNYGLVVSENISPFSEKILSGYPPLTIYSLGLGLILTAITFIGNYKNIRKNSFALCLFVFSSILAIAMTRNMPVFALCMLPISLKNAYEAKWFIQYSWQKAFFCSVMLVVLIVSVIDGEFYSAAKVNRSFGLNIPTYGQEAIDFVKKNNLKGPIFNSFNVGSFLIWQLPDEKVFIDGRPEAYPTDFLQNVYIGMQTNQELFEKFSKQYNFNYIFWDKIDKSAQSLLFIDALKNNPKWQLVFEDNKYLIFTRKVSKN